MSPRRETGICFGIASLPVKVGSITVKFRSSREIEEVHLHFPTRLPIEDFCIPGNLGRYLQSAAQVRFLLAGDLRPDTKTKVLGSLVDCVGVEINFRRTRQRIVPLPEDVKVGAT